MFLWFAGLSWLLVWRVFRSPAVDYRLVILGAVLPLVDVFVGQPTPLHTVAGAVAALAVVMVLARGSRLAQRQWLGVPIGMFAHLLLDTTWADTELFWWPVSGASLGALEIPEVGWPFAVDLVLELIGLGVLLALWVRLGLTEAEHRKRFRKTGHLARDPRVTGTGEIIVVRHGQTAANAQGLLLGRLDTDLDETGRAQAAALAAALPTPDLVITSPLARTRQTATAFGAAVEVDPRWIELDYGAFDGRPAGEVPAAVWAQWRADVDFAPPGGESLAQLSTRVHDALDALAERALSRRVVVVTHVSPIKAAVGWAVGLGPEVSWRTYVAPGSITRIGVGPAGPMLRSFNETRHLDEAAG